MTNLLSVPGLVPGNDKCHLFLRQPALFLQVICFLDAFVDRIYLLSKYMILDSPQAVVKKSLGILRQLPGHQISQQALGLFFLDPVKQ